MVETGVAALGGITGLVFAAAPAAYPYIWLMRLGFDFIISVAYFIILGFIMFMILSNSASDNFLPNYASY